MYASDGVDGIKEEPRSADEMMMLVDSPQQTLITTPTKKAKLNSGGRGNSPAGLMNHNGGHHNASADSETDGQFTCEYCYKAFSKQSSLARHRYEHSGEDCVRYTSLRGALLGWQFVNETVPGRPFIEWV